MKNLFLILVLGIFLMSLNFGSALDGVGYCHASTAYQWLVCDCGSAAVVYDLIHISSVPGLTEHNGAGSCAELGLSCGSNYQCYQGNTVICTDPSWGYSYTFVPNNPLGCSSGGSTCSSPACTCTNWINSSGECSSMGIQNITSTRSCSVNTNCAFNSCNSYSTSLTYLNQPCTYISPSSLSKPYFSTLSDPNTNISSAGLGDTVLMRFPGSGLTGLIVNYSVSVFNSSSVWYNPFSWGSQSWKSSQVLSGAVYEPLVVGLEAIYRFNATIVSTGQSNVSDNLSVVSGANQNSMPVAVISSPLNLGLYKVNSSIDFNQNSTDEDDLLNITWNFGDGQVYSVANYTKVLNEAGANTKHNYSQTGSYNVRLTAKEMARTQQDDEVVVVSIIKEGLNIVPVITSPLQGATVGPGMVLFNISQSFIANCTLCSGSCTGTRSNGFYTNDSLMNCTHLLAPGSSNLLNASARVLVTWSMGDGSQNRVGNWTANYNSVVKFGYYYNSTGTHTATVRMDYYA